MITWTSSDPTIATVDENGLVTPVAFGKTTINAKLGNDTAACLIEVGAAAPDIPADAKCIQYVNLTSTKDWEAVVDGLDICDENGNPYVYYIVEVDANGNAVTSINGNNGAVYVPVSYSGNGVQVDTNGAKDVSVTNEFKERDEDIVTLPMTGGTGTIP